MHIDIISSSLTHCLFFNHHIPKSDSLLELLLSRGFSSSTLFVVVNN